MKALTKEYFLHNKVKMVDGSRPESVGLMSDATNNCSPSPNECGTPVVVIDHDIIRRNFAAFKKHLPKVQAYYAVKANPAPEIVRTLYKAGASFDVASLPEFMLVYEHIRHLPAKERQDFIWDKIVYANPDQAEGDARGAGPVQAARHLRQPGRVAQDQPIRAARGPGAAACACRTPGSMVELSSKFGCDPGEAVDLVEEAFHAGLVVEGLSFHVGSQCTNFENFVQALNMAAAVMREAKTRGRDIKILDIGGGFPVPYDRHVKPFSVLARKINAEIDRLFPKEIEILAEPGRFLVATAATSVARGHRQGRPRRQDLLLHRRQRLPHLLGHHLRPLPVPLQGASRRGRPRSARSSARPATAWTRSRSRRSCRSWRSTIWCTRRTSAPTATRPRPGSTASRPRRSCT